MLVTTMSRMTKMSARITNSMIGIETLLFSVVDGFGQNGFHDEQGAVDLGDPAVHMSISPRFLRVLRMKQRRRGMILHL